MTSIISGITNTKSAAMPIAAFKASGIQSTAASQAGALAATQKSAPVVQALPAFKVSSGAAAAISGLSAASLTNSQQTSLTAKQINAMSKAQVQALNVADIPASQIAGLTSGLTNMSGAQIGALSTQQLAALTSKQVTSLSASQFSSLSDDKFAALSKASYSGLTASEVASLDAKEVASLGTGVATLSTKAVPGLGASQIQALSNTQVAAMSAAQLNALTSAALKTLSTSQIASISTTAMSALSTTALSGMSSTQLGALTQPQVQALTTSQVAGLSQSALSSLKLSYFGAQQVAGLGASTISSMSVSQFDSVVAPNVASLSTAAIKGLTTDQIKSLTAQQASTMTSAQLSAMNTSQKAAYSATYSVLKDAQSLETNGYLSYQSMLQVLQDAANGGMNASKFADLQTLAKALNVSGANGIQTSAYVQQMFDNVVLGNAANATYNGGSSKAAKLGNLTASSNSTQVSELIGKWFLGTDNPSLAGYKATYQAVNQSLFSSGGPQITDVNQGEAGDCYFLSALADTAQQDPSLIQNMVQSNGNGTYSVEFQLNGKADYVTVNNQLAMLPTGQAMGDGSNYAFDHGGTAGSANIWSAIVEKAYVEFREQTDHVNSYANINGGSDNGLNAITGQSATDYYSPSLTTSAQQTSLLQAMQSALTSGNDVLMSTVKANASKNLAASHMYAVIGVNVANGTVTLDNPWNGSGATSTMKMQFTASLSDMIANGVGFHVATGTAATI